MESQERPEMRKTEARTLVVSYLTKLEKTWRKAGLPCSGFEEVRTRATLIESLMSEVGKVYFLTDC